MLRRSTFVHRLAVVAAAALVASAIAFGGGAAGPSAAASVGAGPSPTPNHFDPRTDATSVAHPAARALLAPAKAPPAPVPQRALPTTMTPGTVALGPGAAAHFAGSDGRFAVDVPAGAVTAADVAQAGGSLALRVTQLAPPSGSSAGGSGHVSYGAYRIDLVDRAGHLASRGLRRPATVVLRYDRGAAATDLAHAVAVVGPSSQSGAASAASARTRSVPGSSRTTATTLDPASRTLSASVTLTSSSSSVGFDSEAPVASFGRPDAVNVDLAAGALNFDLPINVPAGPGGLTPPLTLSYSSEAVSESHNLQAAAPWAGEGWNLSLGSISWAERNVLSACSGCSPRWESAWQLTEPSGQGADLVPDSAGATTWFDDTGNPYWYGGTYYGQPVQWHTAPESHSRIYSYVGTNTLPGMRAQVSCFRVFQPNGLMEEFGCTPDSIEWYYVPNSYYGQYMAQWLPDLITDPQGNQVHVTYQSHAASLSGVPYTRDVVPATVEWDSPGCHSSRQACTGSAWAPLMRVDFVASSTIARATAANGNPCNTGFQMRCDDPLDLGGSGGAAAPEVQSTFALNDLQVQVRSSAATAWSTLRDYQFSYEVGGPGGFYDPVSGLPTYYAGVFDLTQLKVVGDDGATSLPVRTFAYTTVVQHYEDGSFPANPSGNCGWSWNVYCVLWSRSADGNGRYLSSASSGLGLAQSFTWAEAQNNTYGVGWTPRPGT